MPDRRACARTSRVPVAPASLSQKWCPGQEQLLEPLDALHWQRVSDLALDWLSGVLYVADAGASRVEALAVEGRGRHRRVLLAHDALAAPQSLAVHPTAG